MAAISFAAPASSTTDPTTSQAMSDKGRAFVSTFSDAAQNAAKPVEAKTQGSDSKDKDRKDDKDDRQDASGDGSTTATATARVSDTTHTRDTTASDDKKSEGKDKTSSSATVSAAKSAGRPDDADDDTVDTSETPADAAELAPVLDALKQLAAATRQASTDTAPPPAPPVAQADTAADLLPATASLLAARVVPASAQQVEAKAATPAKKNARSDAAADATATIDAATASPSLTTASKSSLASDAGTIAQPSAGQQLAAGGADRALDVAKQGAWLDGLARDIATTGDSSSTLRFQAAPTHLGSVQVEIARGLDGAAVTLTASSEGARSALADARPQLIAEARAQGIHIASAQVDVSTDSRQSSNGSQPDQRHDPHGGTSFSSQSGGEGRSNGQSQTRSQPFAVNQTSESQPAATAETEEPVTSTAPTGGMYA